MQGEALAFVHQLPRGIVSERIIGARLGKSLYEGGACSKDGAGFSRWGEKCFFVVSLVRVATVQVAGRTAILGTLKTDQPPQSVRPRRPSFRTVASHALCTFAALAGSGKRRQLSGSGASLGLWESELLEPLRRLGDRRLVCGVLGSNGFEAKGNQTVTNQC